MTHDSSDTGTAVPIQRYRTNHIDGDYYPFNGGELVLYADHVAAVAEAERISSKVIADFQRQAREAALREALAAVEALPSVLNCWDRYGFHIEKNDATAVLQRLIDGGNE